MPWQCACRRIRGQETPHRRGRLLIEARIRKLPPFVHEFGSGLAVQPHPLVGDAGPKVAVAVPTGTALAAHDTTFRYAYLHGPDEVPRERERQQAARYHRYE